MVNMNKKEYFTIERKHLLELVMAIIMLFLIYIFSGKIPALKANQNKENENIKTVVIDPGHGGVDGGAVSVRGDSEKEINLSISLLLSEMLEEKGIVVIMTRDSDVGLYEEGDSNKKVADMKSRCKIANDSKADLLVSVHQNNYQSEGVKGAQVFYYSRSLEGEKLAKTLQSSLKANLDKDNGRQAKANDNYYILINVPCPAVIVECGFLSNYIEAELLVSDEYQKKVAQALCDGICEYLED